jgi:hypothetical protein
MHYYHTATANPADAGRPPRACTDRPGPCGQPAVAATSLNGVTDVRTPAARPRRRQQDPGGRATRLRLIYHPPHGYQKTMYQAPDGRPKGITRGDAAEAGAGKAARPSVQIEHLTRSSATGPQAPPRLSHGCLHALRIALSAILDCLSRAYYAERGIKFPPPGWKPSKRQLAAVA